MFYAGEPPVDPSVGFLPPNNGTDGQGYVTFTIRPKQQVSSLSRIDARATIIFDQNEPIDTPPIFNTVYIHAHAREKEGGGGGGRTHNWEGLLKSIFSSHIAPMI